MDLSRYTWYQRLKAIRVANSLSQIQAADKCGTTQKTYSNWELGKSIPHKNNRKAIASALGVKEEQLFEGVESNGKAS